MTAARTLLDAGSWTSSDGAANDGPLASWAGHGAFWTHALGEVRSHTDGSTTLGPGTAGVVGARDGGAETLARLVACWADGSTYEGDLWLDILAYRGLRMRGLGGARLDAEQRATLDDLERRLGTKDAGGARQFTRFSCHRATRLSTPQGAAEVVLVDLSAGGAKLEVVGATPAEGAEVALHVEAAGGPLDMLLPSRVIWTRPGVLGIMFAGAARRGR